ncbi:MAG: HEPN domain-containing protein [Clostridium sp.]|jgi:uncharacterized protein (UPF0332 family)|nr:HEPN domain-containing protein [Clostridium sp.]
MEGSIIVLSKYRFRCALEDLEIAHLLLQEGKYKASVNRSYYAVFHGLRSVTALDQYDSNKHSGVIAYFNHTYVKNRVFDKSISKIIDTVYRLREKADYQDFVVISREQATEQTEKAQNVLNIIKPYLDDKWTSKTV